MRTPKIALIFAMQGEAQGIIDHFNLKELEATKPTKLYSNDDGSLLVSLNGHDSRTGVDNIGTSAATLNTHIVINEYKPDLIVNCGAAGGFAAKGAKIGDVYLAYDKIYFHDRHIPINEAFQRYALGNFTTINTKALASTLNLKTGIASTSNSINYTSEEMQFMLDKNVALKDMEAAATAWVCSLHDQPLIVMKSITDFVDEHEASSAFVSNFNTAIRELTTQAIILINHLQEHFKTK